MAKMQAKIHRWRKAALPFLLLSMLDKRLSRLELGAKQMNFCPVRLVERINRVSEDKKFWHCPQKP